MFFDQWGLAGSREGMQSTSTTPSVYAGFLAATVGSDDNLLFLWLLLVIWLDALTFGGAIML
jgi:hypothetical protein